MRPSTASRARPTATSALFGKTSLQFERDFRLRGVNPRSRARHLVIVSSAVDSERGQPPLYARRYLVLPTVLEREDRRPARWRPLFASPVGLVESADCGR